MPPYLSSLVNWRSSSADQQQQTEASSTETTALSTFIASAAPELLAAREARPSDALLSRASESDEHRDRILRRYLASCSMDPTKALTKLSRTLQWRSEHQLETVPFSIVGGPGVRMPVYISRMGLGYSGEQLMYAAVRYTVKPLDYSALEKAIGVLFDTVFYTPAPHGCDANDLFVVVDLHGLSLSQFDLQSFRVGIPVYLNHYSGVFKRICVLNYTLTMHTLWRCISPLLDQDTRDRVVFVTGGELRNELEKVFPSSVVPIWLGGAGEVACDSGEVSLENGSKVDGENLLKRLREGTG